MAVQGKRKRFLKCSNEACGHVGVVFWEPGKSYLCPMCQSETKMDAKLNKDVPPDDDSSTSVAPSPPKQPAPIPVPTQEATLQLPPGVRKGPPGARLVSALGSPTTYEYEDPDPGKLEVFPNPRPDRDYSVNLLCPEFTSLCPRTGQPDFAEVSITYVPHQFCVETKSLKLYLVSYRNHGAFMEAIVNKILKDLVKATNPRKMIVEGRFNPRGGIGINVRAEYDCEDKPDEEQPTK